MMLKKGGGGFRFKRYINIAYGNLSVDSTPN